MTGLAILLTQANLTDLSGAAMTTYAFQNGLFIPLIGKYIVNIGLVFFAFTTIIGWNYYGERCMYYLKGLKAVKVYKIIFIACIAIGPFMSLIGLRKVVIAETQAYFGLKSVQELQTAES